MIALLLGEDAAAVFLHIKAQLPRTGLAVAEHGAEILIIKFHAVFLRRAVGHVAHQFVLLIGADEQRRRKRVEPALLRGPCRLKKAHFVAFDAPARDIVGGLYTTQDDAFVQDVLALHTAAIAEKGAQEHRRHAYQLGADYTEQFYITYRMADGTLTERYYSIVYNDAELKDPDSLISRFSALYNSPVCVRIRAGFDTPRTEKSVLSCYVSSYDTGASLDLTGSDAWRVYEACLDDINAGLLGAADVSGSTKQSDGSNYTPLSLIFTVSTDVPGQTDSLYVDSIPLSAAETVSALQALGADPYWRAAG